MFIRYRYILALACLMFSGCEGVPLLPVVDPEAAKPVSNDLVSEQGRGGYDWLISSNEKFEITPVSNLTVFDSIDLNQIKETVPQFVYVEPTKPYRPEGMTDSAYHDFSRFTEPYFDTKPILEIPFVPSEIGLFKIDAKGDRLALLNGSTLEIWNLIESKVANKFPVASSQPTCLEWSHDQEHVMVVDSTGIAKIAVESGMNTCRWQPPASDSPIKLVHAGKSPNYVVSTKKGSLYVLDEQLTTTHTHNSRSVEPNTISIQPDGKAVIAIAGKEVIQWNLPPTNRMQIEVLQRLEDYVSETELMAGTNTSYIIQPSDFYSVHVGESINVKHAPLSRIVHAICLGTVDYSDEFLTGCLSNRNAQGEQEFFLQDFFLADRTVSLAYPLGCEPILELIASRNTSVFAVRDKEKVRVHKRQRWKIDIGDWVAHDVIKMILKGEFDQAELLASELAKMPRTRAMAGYALTTYFADAIGKKWIKLERENSSADLAMLEKWRKTDSELSILASSSRHLDKVDDLVRGAARSVSGNATSEIEAHLSIAKRELDILLARPNPASATLYSCMRVRALERENLEELTPYIQQFLESYILDLSTHAIICICSLPQWGGRPGEAGSYLANAADLLPPPYADILYAKVALRFYKRYGAPPVFGPTQGGLSPARITRAVELLIHEKALRTDEAETLIEILCISSERRDLMKKTIVDCLERDTLTPLLLGSSRLNRENSTQVGSLEHERMKMCYDTLEEERNKMLQKIRGTK